MTEGVVLIGEAAKWYVIWKWVDSLVLYFILGVGTYFIVKNWPDVKKFLGLN